MKEFWTGNEKQKIYEILKLGADVGM